MPMDFAHRLPCDAPLLRRLRAEHECANCGSCSQCEGDLTDAADEIERLRDLLRAYVADEDRFNQGQGEAYGSITTETGMRARAAVRK